MRNILYYEEAFDQHMLKLAALLNESWKNKFTVIITLTGLADGTAFVSVAGSVHPVVSATTATDASVSGAMLGAQVDLLDFSLVTSVRPGDTLTATVGGTTYTVTAGTDGTSVDDLGTALATAVADGEGANLQSAVYDANTDIITLTGLADGTAFVSVAGSVHPVVSATTATDASVSGAMLGAQVDLLDFSLVTSVRPGDTLTATVGGTTYTVTAGTDGNTVDILGTALAVKVASSSSLQNAVYDTGTDILTLTGLADGTAFVSAADSVHPAVNATTATDVSALPTSAQAQISTITLGGGIFDASDIVTVSIDGTNYLINPTAGQTGSSVADALVLAINSGLQHNLVTAANNSGTLVITENNPATGGFDLTGSGITNHTALTNTAAAEITAVALSQITAVAQVDVVTFTATTPAIGETYSVTLDTSGTAHTYTYTVVAGASLTTALNNLKSQITASTDGTNVTVVRSGAELIISDKVAGTGFTTTVETTDTGAAAAVQHPTASVAGQVAQAEVIDVTFGGGNFDIGDQVTLTVAGNTSTLNVATIMTSTEVVDHFVSSFAVSGATLSDVAGVLHIVATATNGISLAVNSSVPINTAVHANTLDIVATHDNFAAAIAQIDTITLSADGTLDAGDVIRVTVGANHYDHAVAVNETMDQVGTILHDLITAGETGLSNVVYTAADNTLVLTGAVNGTAFTSASSFTTNVITGAGAASQSIFVTGVTTAAAQVDTITLTADGTLDAGDVIRVTVGTNHYDHTVAVGETMDQVGAIIHDAITAGETGLSEVVYTAGANTLVLTGAVDGTAFTSASSFTTNAIAGEGAANQSIFVIGGDAALAQIDTITLSLDATLDTDDVIRVTVGSNNYDHTVAVGETMDQVGVILHDAITAGETGLSDVVYTAAANTLVLTGAVDGTAFTSASSFTTNATAGAGAASTNTFVTGDTTIAAQVDTITLSADGTLNAGDVINVTVGANHYDHTVAVGETMDQVGVSLQNAITIGETGLSNVVYSAVANTLVLTGAVDGTAFTSASSITDIAVGEGVASYITSVNGKMGNTAQVTSITFAGDNSQDQGDTYTLVIDPDASGATPPTTVSYTTAGNESWFDILSALGDAIDTSDVAADFTWDVTATGSGAGTCAEYKLNLTAANAGTAFSVTTSAINRPAGATNDQATQETIMDNVVHQSAVPQESTINLGADTLDAGDVVNVTIAGAEFHYTVTGHEASNSAIVDQLVTLVDGTAAPITSSNVDGVLHLTGDAQGHGFTFTSDITNIVIHTNGTADNNPTENAVHVDAVAQVCTIALTQGSVEAGDNYSITIDPDGDGAGSAFTVNYVTAGDETVGDIANALMDSIDVHNAGLRVSVVESVNGSGDFDQLHITADNAGTAFTVMSDVTNRAVGIHDDNGISQVVIHDNVVEVLAVAQESTVTLTAGTIEAGDHYSITIDPDANGTGEAFTVDYVTAGDETVGDIANTLLEFIDGHNAGLLLRVVESVTDSGDFDQLLITAGQTGTAFTFSSEVVNRAEGIHLDNTISHDTIQINVAHVAAQSQIDVMNLHNELFVAGDIVDLQLADILFQYTVQSGDTNTQIATALAAQVDPTDAYIATADGTAVTITAQVLGVPFDAHVGVNLV